MNHHYQTNKPYTRLPQTSVHGSSVLQYADSILSKSRNIYSSRPTDSNIRVHTHQSTGQIDIEPKRIYGSPQLISQSSMIQQQQLKSKAEYQSPKKYESPCLHQKSESGNIALIPTMSQFKEDFLKQKQSKSQSQATSPVKKSYDRFKNFIVIRKLGQGKYSEVYLAYHQPTGFLVALKVIQKEQIIKENMQNQLAWEIKIQYLLEHPNITRLFTFFQTQKEIVLVLEYCPNGQLSSLQQQQISKKFTENEAQQYIQQVTLALMYIHNQDVIHRDIKPDNILLSFGQVKLADFSFCVYSPEDQYRQTQCGTVVYASPQILEGEMYDKKSDIWGLGVLTYELCFGKPPWKENQQELIKTACFMIPYSASRQLRDFIENLVKRLSKDRFTAEQAFNHNWLQRSQQMQPYFIKLNQHLFE